MTDQQELSTIVAIIQGGGIIAAPTDTLWGLLGLALKPETVARLYHIRGRDRTKPFIILISSLADLSQFNIELSPAQKDKLTLWWPGPISVILGETAFRLPARPWLQELLRQTGPLVAPSANLAGETPAKTRAEAEDIFGKKIDYYYAPSNNPAATNFPSTLVRLNSGGTYQVLRSGAGNTRLLA